MLGHVCRTERNANDELVARCWPKCPMPVTESLTGAKTATGPARTAGLGCPRATEGELQSSEDLRLRARTEEPGKLRKNPASVRDQPVRPPFQAFGRPHSAKSEGQRAPMVLWRTAEVGSECATVRRQNFPWAKRV